MLSVKTAVTNVPSLRKYVSSILLFIRAEKIADIKANNYKSCCRVLGYYHQFLFFPSFYTHSDVFRAYWDSSMLENIASIKTNN